MALLRDSEQLILEAAREEFAAQGFAGARTQRIADRAGVNKQLLFYYFGSKQGLWDAVLAGAGEVLADPATAPATSAGALREQLLAALRQIVEQPDTARLLVAGSSGGGGNPGADAVQSLVGRLSKIISHGQGIGFFRDDADPALAARQLAALALGYLAAEGALEPAEAGRERRVAWMDSAVELLLTALRW